MKRLVLVLIFFLVLIRNLYADCDISKYNIVSIKTSYNTLLIESNAQTATKFFNSIPEKFCEFNMIFGYPENKKGPLSDLQLYQVLPILDQYIPTNRLFSKYLKLASESKWNADNVNYLQKSYRRIFENNLNLAISLIMKLPNQKRMNAITFLIDGPHPSNKLIEPEHKEKIFKINKQFYLELKQIEDKLLIKEKNEH